MAVQKIDYANKVRGDLFTTSNANEVKNVVNNNADELTSLSNQVQQNNNAVTQLGNAVSGLREEAKIVVIQQTETSVTIHPNKLNVWGSVAALTIVFAAGTQGVANEYMLEFTASTDSFTLTLPSGVRWVEDPEWQAGYTYQVSILNGLAVYAGWEAPGA
jgi:prophage DNA circulation protein